MAESFDPERRFFKKICDQCGKEEALVFLRIIKDGIVEEKGFCARCALQYLEDSNNKMDFAYIDERVLHSLTQVRDILGHIIEGVESVAKSKSFSEIDNLNCPNCGMTFRNFIESGLLGCSYCYSALRKGIKEYIFDFERGLKHKGKMPKKYASLFILKKEVAYLSNKIKRLLLLKNYEEAEKIRKKLEKLIGACPINYEDELY